MINLDATQRNTDWIKTLNADFPLGITLEEAQHAQDQGLPVTLAPNWPSIVVKDWDEDLHPRDATGKFTNGAGGEFPARVGGNQDIARVMVPRFRDWAYKQLTPAEQWAMVAYTESSSVYNNYLRGKITDSDLLDDPEKFREMIDTITSALDKAETDREYVTFRGIYAGAIGDSPPVLADLQVGDSFQDKAFVSTSLDAHTASGWARGPEGVLFRITIPEGSHAAYVSALGIVARTEDEMLIQRNSTFEVTKVTPNYEMVVDRPEWQHETEGKTMTITIGKVIDVKLVQDGD